MSSELIINASLPETRIAQMEDGEIQELLIERASGKGIVGNIYKGRVTRVLPGMQAAFVDIGLEKAAFLYVDDVYVHSEIWEEEEESAETAPPVSDVPAPIEAAAEAAAPAAEAAPAEASGEAPAEAVEPVSEEFEDYPGEEHDHDHDHGIEGDFGGDEDEDENDDEDQDPVEMGPDENGDQPSGTVAPPSGGGGEGGGNDGEGGGGEGRGGNRRRHRRGRRGGRFRRRDQEGKQGQAAGTGENGEPLPDNLEQQLGDVGEVSSDRSELSQEGGVTAQPVAAEEGSAGRPESAGAAEAVEGRRGGHEGRRAEFQQQRSRDRRIRPKQSARPVRAQVNIQDLLKEGQEVIVQVAKDPIATKGARLTCHLSLPGRHLVCMPTIDHVGVSRRIERDDERRKLREHVEKYRPKNLGFIVRTASGKQNSEQRIKQDIEYLTRIWNEIKEKANSVTAPALVYEDLNSVLRAIRDWVTDDIDKIVVDSRYHYNEIQRFVSHFMPSLRSKVELYHGDIPIFDAYKISTELSRALERKVWLKSGGYIVIDQAEALVAIDVNTGRFVGKKNLEDTILKTNLEAVQEIAYQLRLRNCGGIIILDLIDMEKEENKQRVYRALEDALKKDRARPSILKISELGLVEMTRKRTRDTMVRALCESCTHCEGKGFIKSKQTVAYEVLREVEREGIEKDMSKILVQAHADVIDILAIEERETLDQLERRYRKQVYLQAMTDFHVEQFEVSGDKQPGASRAQMNDRSRDQRENRESRGGGGENRGDRNRGGRDRDRGRNRDRGGDRERGGRDRDRGGRRDQQREQPQMQVQSGESQVSAPAAQAEPVDPDSQANFLNRISPKHAPPPMDGNAVVPQQGGPDEIYDEEDRLAFLRAQAAQDAALAKFRGGTGPEPVGGKRQHQGGGSRDGGGGGGGGRGGRGRRGRRGGKFRQGGRDGGGGGRHAHSHGNGGGGGNRGGNGGGGEGGGAGGGGNAGPAGGGDSGHSQPPA